MRHLCNNLFRNILLPRVRRRYFSVSSSTGDNLFEELVAEDLSTQARTAITHTETYTPYKVSIARYSKYSKYACRFVSDLPLIYISCSHFSSWTKPRLKFEVAGEVMVASVSRSCLLAERVPVEELEVILQFCCMLNTAD